MTTAEIEELADFDKSGAVDYPAGKVLRLKVIPEYLSRIGLVEWRRMTEAKRVGPGDTGQDINPHIGLVESVWCVEPRRQLTFIGDDSYRLLQSVKDIQTPGVPSEYYLTYNKAGVYLNAPAPNIDGQVGPRRLNLGAPVDAVYELAIAGWMIPYFEDFTTPVDMNSFIPLQFQWGLVEGLKAQIFRERYGRSDPRTGDARGEYEAAIAAAAEFRGTSIEETPRYA